VGHVARERCIIRSVKKQEQVIIYEGKGKDVEESNYIKNLGFPRLTAWCVPM